MFLIVNCSTELFGSPVKMSSAASEQRTSFDSVLCIKNYRAFYSESLPADDDLLT